MRYLIAIIIINIMSANAFAARKIDVAHQPNQYLHQFGLMQKKVMSHSIQFNAIQTHIDFNQVAHVRYQEYFANYPVWNAIFIVHTPIKTLKNSHANALTANGIIYTDLEKDLYDVPKYFLNKPQSMKALTVLKAFYMKNHALKKTYIHDEPSQTIIYVDPEQHAHYAFLTSFYTDDGKTGAHQPTAIIDAINLKTYKTWDQVKRYDPIPDGSTPINAGGIGGNEKTGPIIYDGALQHLPTLALLFHKVTITRRNQSYTWPVCFFGNKDVLVIDLAYDKIPALECDTEQGQHNNLPWIYNDRMHYPYFGSGLDSANGAYSPSLDAVYSAAITKSLYNDWYQLPVLVDQNGLPMKLIIRVHYGRDFPDAFWDGKEITFSDGNDVYYPLVALDVVAHEMSHGFSDQHSGLDYSLEQGAALQESFSDIAGAAAKFYATHQNDWWHGATILKQPGVSERYMDDPKKDGHSIDNYKDFHPGAGDPHYDAGIFNKAFYLIATSPGWDIHKAFNVMVKANMDYWIPTTTFVEAACGVMSATKDYNYNLADVKLAFAKVGIDIGVC